jgi:phosphate transport system protein
MTRHLSKQFDLELESIRTRILQMGGLVERQLMAAIDAFSTGNIEAMQEVIEPTLKWTLTKSASTRTAPC